MLHISHFILASIDFDWPQSTVISFVDLTPMGPWEIELRRFKIMFTKYFFTALVSTLALSAFSADTQAGRYRVEGPGNSGGISQQGGRGLMAFSGPTSTNVGSNEQRFASQGSNLQPGRGLMAFSSPNDGGSRSSSYSREAYIAEPSVVTEAVRTQRNQAIEVSAPRVNSPATGK